MFTRRGGLGTFSLGQGSGIFVLPVYFGALFCFAASALLLAACAGGETDRAAPPAEEDEPLVIAAGASLLINDDLAPAEPHLPEPCEYPVSVRLQPSPSEAPLAASFLRIGSETADPDARHVALCGDDARDEAGAVHLLGDTDGRYSIRFACPACAPDAGQRVWIGRGIQAGVEHEYRVRLYSEPNEPPHLHVEPVRGVP